MDSLYLLEDDLALREVLGALFREKGYKVSEFTGVESLLRATLSDIPSIIVSDLNLDDLTGFDLIRILKKDPVLKKVPIIIITADSSLESKMKGLNIGANDFIVKPFLIEELHLKIKNILGIRDENSDDKFRLDGKELLLESEIIKQGIRSFVMKTTGEDLMDYDALSFYLNMSRSTLQKKVKKFFGCTVSELVNLVKLDLAKIFLESTDLPINQIAVTIGFNSAVYFNTVFRKQVGISPRKYRQQKRSK